MIYFHATLIQYTCCRVACYTSHTSSMTCPGVCCVISIFFSFTLVPICSVLYLSFLYIFSSCVVLRGTLYVLLYLCLLKYMYVEKTNKHKLQCYTCDCLCFRLDNVRTLYSTLGINVLMLEYRGYGKSTDTPSEKGSVMNSCFFFT